MFTGFSVNSIHFFEKIMKNNNRTYFGEHKEEYVEYIREPLKALHSSLSATLYDIDSELCFKLQHCISTAYTDARFNKSNPIKGYMFLRFKLLRSRKEDIPGFFFDASKDNIRYGLQVYNLTTKGMAAIRNEFLKDKKYSTSLANKIEGHGTIGIYGKDYAKDHYPDIEVSLKNWLNKKEIMLCYTSEIKESYFTPELANEIREIFLELKDVYLIMKKGLDRQDYRPYIL